MILNWMLEGGMRGCCEHVRSPDMAVHDLTKPDCCRCKVVKLEDLAEFLDKYFEQVLLLRLLLRCLSKPAGPGASATTSRRE